MRPVPIPRPARRGRTGAFERLRALPEHRVVDRLLRGRAWIWLIGLLLGGIVAMQVSLLKLNTGISRAVTATATLERQNAALEDALARLSSSERIGAAALAEGMVTPPPGEVEYLRTRPERDARRAVHRMLPPSDEATEVMANGGRDPDAVALLAPVTVDPATVDPAAVDPATVDPATVDPAAVDPATVDPAVTGTDPADPSVTGTDPAATDPSVTGTDPAATDPSVTGTDPAATDPAAVGADPGAGAVVAPTG
jgi:hypothetical protein